MTKWSRNKIPDKQQQPHHNTWQSHTAHQYTPYVPSPSPTYTCTTNPLPLLTLPLIKRKEYGRERLSLSAETRDRMILNLQSLLSS